MSAVPVRYERIVATRSRNVARYVRAVRVMHALANAAEQAHATHVLARGKLTGAQLAEARAILASEDLL